MLVSVLVRDLPSDADLSASESLAEFSALSGDSFWKRSGLQIERMEVGDKKQALPTWSIVTIATVVPVIAAVACKSETSIHLAFTYASFDLLSGGYCGFGASPSSQVAERALRSHVCHSDQRSFCIIGNFLLRSVV